MNPPRVIPVGQELPPLVSESERRTVERRASDRNTKRRGASRDRFRVLNSFVDVSLRNLDATAAAIWLVLYRDTKPDGCACTGQTDIARRVGKSTRTVRAAASRLVQAGLLVVVRKGRIGTGATVYRVRGVAQK